MHSPADVHEAKRSGRLGICFNLEGTRALGDQLSMVEFFHSLGVKWMLMAYNRNNSVGGGCQDDDSGLTPFGREVLDEMTRVGMVPCCSHTGWRTAMQVMEHAAGPVIFSHSNSHAVHAHPRNIPDELIKACAATGGVIGINGVGPFLGVGEDGPVAAMVRHIDHMVQLVGPDHVGPGARLRVRHARAAGLLRGASRELSCPRKAMATISSSCRPSRSRRSSICCSIAATRARPSSRSSAATTCGLLLKPGTEIQDIQE